MWFVKSHWCEFLMYQFKGENRWVCPSSVKPRILETCPGAQSCQLRSHFSCPYRGSCGRKRCEACCFHRLLCFLGKTWSGARLRESPTRAPSRPAAFPGSTCLPHTGLPRRPGCGNASPPPAWNGPEQSHSRESCGQRTVCRRTMHHAESLVSPWGPGVVERLCRSEDFHPTGCRDQIQIFPCEIPNTETKRERKVHFKKKKKKAPFYSAKHHEGHVGLKAPK